MTNRMKLGPLAVFLTIITIILTMLALLEFVTANADVALAERYAQVTQTKYALEQKGNEYLRELDTSLKNGLSPESAGEVTVKQNGLYTHTEKLEEYTLTIDFESDGSGYEVKRWKITREWKEGNPFGNIWQP